jgi:hypothetical protein
MPDNGILQTIKKSLMGTQPYSLPLVLFSTTMAIIIFRDEEKVSLVKKLLYDRMFFVSLMLIGIFSGYNLMLHGSGKEMIRRKRATREAILGFIIAIMAYLDLKAAPFWVIFVVSYYYE